VNKFDKTCPECGAANATGAVQCGCGYLFNPLYLEDPRLALELSVREEKLIEEYLTARLEQAGEAARAAAHRADMDQDDARKAVEAAMAQLDAEVAQVELSEQRARVTEAENKLGATKTADTASAEANESWRAVIIAEAMKAKGQTDRPGPAFRSAQAAKAERAVKGAKDLETMQCPSCGAKIPVAAVSCRCGWSISRSLPKRDTASQPRSMDERATPTDDLDTKKPAKPR
jgi:ribosomal protein L40E